MYELTVKRVAYASMLRTARNEELKTAIREIIARLDRRIAAAEE
jgi:hypothetical protein